MQPKRDPVQTEILAVSTLSILFSSTEHIRPCFSSTDKTPLYDGEILVYRNKQFSNGDIFGRIPVQIKGKNVDDFSEPNSSFRILKRDLQSYLTDGGVFFFLVEINTNGDTRIFRNSLLPFDIKQLLSSNNKKSVNVPMFEFDTNSNAMLKEFKAYCNDKNKQAGQVSQLIMGDSEELAENGTLHFELFSDTEEFSPFDLVNKKTYFYKIPQELEKYKIQIPVGIVDYASSIEVSENTLISVGGQTYYTSLRRIASAGKVTLIFSEGIKLVCELDKSHNEIKTITLNYTPLGTLQACAHDLEFMRLVVEQQQFCIGNTPVPFLPFNEKRKDFLGQDNIYAKLREHLQSLGISKELNYGELSEDEKNDFIGFMGSFIPADAAFLAELENPRLVNYSFGDITITAIRLEDSEKRLHHLGIYDERYRVCCNDDSDEKHPMPIEAIMSKETFIASDNIDLMQLPQRIQLLPPSESLDANLNFMLLNLLGAFDESIEDAGTALQTCLAVAEYLYERDSASATYTINLVQVKVRSKCVDDSDYELLKELLASENLSEEECAACHALLGNGEEAKRYLASVEDVNTFLSYPIVHFF